MNYPNTHPWLTFELDLRSASPKFWSLLADACARCEFISDLPIRPEDWANLRQVFLERGARATTAIEGNTLSDAEVALLARGDLALPPSRAYLGVEVQNILDIYNHISDRVAKGEAIPLNADWVKHLNGRVMANLNMGEGIIAGETRNVEVGVGRYRCPPAAECDYLLARLFQWLNDMDNARIGEHRLALPILKSIVAHLYLLWIHPFGDGNGRTARLLEHQILLVGGVPETATHLPSDFYNRTRDAYYGRLDASSRTPNGVIDFLIYALQGFSDELKEQMDYMSQRVWRDTWASYVRSEFQGKHTAAAQRRIELASNLTDEPVSRLALPTLTPALARAYQGKTPSVLTRDLNALARMRLIERGPDGVTANFEMLSLHRLTYAD